jgi:hypothetical protein
MPPAPPEKSKGEKLRELRTTLTQLQSLDDEIRRREEMLNPLSYGMPDLLRDRGEKEAEEEFEAWRDNTLREFIESKLWIIKDGRKRPVQLSDEMLRFIADLFYRRVSLAILWKGRGSGGSLCTAIIIWLTAIYHQMSFTNMAGSQEQGKVVYGHVKNFWLAFPDLQRNLLDGDPLVGETRFKSGQIIKTISASDKQSRGKHNPGFVADETCQEAENTDRLIMAAMQGAMSEQDHMVILLSTFHHPIGLFQEVWDFAEERGFAKYKWNVYEAMAPCEDGLELATPEDPEAVEAFCKVECPLTRNIEVYNEVGEFVGKNWKGCRGVARSATGFMTRKQVMVAQQMNRGTNIFEVEFECERPNWMRPVYDPEWVDAILVDEDWPGSGARLLEKSVGIDWGLTGQTALILTGLLEVPTNPNAAPPDPRNRFEQEPPYRRVVGVLEQHFMTGELTPEAIRVLYAWQEKYGTDKFNVYADASHPYNNLEVTNAGFDVQAVPFQKWKDYGIGNCTKFLTSRGRCNIRRNLTGFLEQVKRYRLNKVGKPIKKDDHGPDAWLCAMLHYNYEDLFHVDVAEEMEGVEESMFPMRKRPSFSGMSAPVTRPPVGLPQPPDRENAHYPKPKKSSDGQIVML